MSGDLGDGYHIPSSFHPQRQAMDERALRVSAEGWRQRNVAGRRLEYPWYFATIGAYMVQSPSKT